MVVLTEIRKAILKKGLISTVSARSVIQDKKEEPQKRLSRQNREKNQTNSPSGGTV
jgi:hypothetical protein